MFRMHARDPKVTQWHHLQTPPNINCRNFHENFVARGWKSVEKSAEVTMEIIKFAWSIAFKLKAEAPRKLHKHANLLWNISLDCPTPSNAAVCVSNRANQAQRGASISTSHESSAHSRGGRAKADIRTCSAKSVVINWYLMMSVIWQKDNGHEITSHSPTQRPT